VLWDKSCDPETDSGASIKLNNVFAVLVLLCPVVTSNQRGADIPAVQHWGVCQPR